MAYAANQSIPVMDATKGVTAKVPYPTTTRTGPMMAAPVTVQPYVPPLQKKPATTTTTPTTPPPPLSSGTTSGRTVTALSSSPAPTPTSGAGGFQPTPQFPAPTGGVGALPTPPPPTVTLPPATPSGPPALPPAAPAPTAPGASTSNLTGNEAPFSILPQQSQGLQNLLTQIQGAAGNALQNPTVYDDPLYKQITDAEKANVNENFGGALSDLTSELANRGINFSSIAGGRLNDLYTAKARALSDIDTNAAAQRANDLATGRTSAMQQALGAAGLQQGIEESNLGNLQSERAYEDQLSQQARDQSLQELLLPYQLAEGQQSAYDQITQEGLNYGNAPAADAFLNTAGGLFQDNSQLYGGMAQTSNQALSDSGDLQALLKSLGLGGSSDISAILALA